MAQPHELAKHVGDTVAMTAGLSTTAAFWLDKIINPLLTTMVLTATFIWTFYRIREMHEKRNAGKKENE